MDILIQWKAEILTIMFGVLTCWLAIQALTLQKRALARKAFALGGVSRVIFTGPVERAAEFEIRFRGDVVTRITENHAFFMNTGNVEIAAEDFHLAAALVLPETEHVYDCEVIGSRPTDLRPEVSASVKDGVASITLTPLLLNPGDFVAVRFLRTGRVTTRGKAGRIKGVPTLDPLLPGQYARWFTSYPLTVGLMGLVCLAYGAAVFLGIVVSNHTTPHYFGLFPMSLGASLCTAAIAHRVRWRALRRASYMGKGTEYLDLEPSIRE